MPATDSNYWTRRFSRRRLLAGGTGLAGGLAVASVVGCGGGSESTTSGGGNRQTVLNAAVYPNDGRRIFTPAPQNSRGGTLTYIGFDPVVLDRFDPHQTQFGPMYANQSAIFSKLYMYKSHEEPTWDNILGPGGERTGDGWQPSGHVYREAAPGRQVPRQRQDPRQLPLARRAGTDGGRRHLQLRSPAQPEQPAARLLLPLQPVRHHRHDGEGGRLHYPLQDEGAGGALLPLHGGHQRHDRAEGGRGLGEGHDGRHHWAQA